MKIIATVVVSYAGFCDLRTDKPVHCRYGDDVSGLMLAPAGIPPKWNYEQGVILKAIDAMWYATGDAKYFNHIQKGMDY
jgi:unsaturated rhamnogalacturonyl hydrolase